ncbi:S41 family peptidase [Butyrivibrio hungatei]|uniref:Peptidase S41 family n=1 Tax=Butyrivibrio hungatei TaxID=185008 RepID=A0A1D9P4G0_9FIRM|nr:S41 family peptidase [Butyrivibrio hungatei]AOZ97496.1 peptidase S41 family [Butyrivibrio hungatei]
MENNEYIEQDNGQENEQEEGLKSLLTKRLVAGILIGFLCSMFVCSAVALFLASNVFGINKDNSEILTQETVNKIKKLEAVIDSNYYKTEIDKEKETDGLYKGLLDSLGDPYSVYYTEEELNDLMTDTAGVYYGIGAYVGVDQTLNYPRISGIIPGSPAEAAGLLPEDIIYEVDKESTQGLELEDVVSMIKGEKGTSVHLTLLRGADAEEVEVDVIRDAVEVPTVTTKVMDDGIGYLQITEFDDVTPDQFIEGMAELRESNIKGLIIDLRSNPGGSLQAVCEIARQLLPQGTIVYTVDRDGNREDYTCDGEHEIDIPVVVLVNKYSASASEILSGALKDYNKAKLVGTTTYGKGIVQRIFDLKDGTAIKLTVSSYFTPNGVNIHGVGIEPDVEVEFDADAYSEDKTDNQLDKAVEVIKQEMD